MNPIFRRVLAVWLLAALLPAPMAGAWGQDYPSRPIRLVLGFPSGGTPDALARSVATQLEAQLGRSFVVDNRTGANGIIAAEIVATAPPDGYTMLFSPPALIINQIVQQKPSYDVLRDLAPVANICMGAGFILVVNASVPAKSVKELVALARARDNLSYGTPGIGNTQHLAGELFNLRAGTRLLHVPYKGLTPAITAVLSGEVSALFVPPTVVMPHIKAGKLRALGFTGGKRWQFMPELPTIAEAGVPGFEVSGSWQGWFAPARTPREIVSRLHAEIGKALKVPKVHDFILTGGYEPDGRGPEEFRRLIQSDLKKYAEIVRVAGIKAE
jgi:tripartite-type tricarboxylate transporter receptor subunit TctC